MDCSNPNSSVSTKPGQLICGFGFLAFVDDDDCRGHSLSCGIRAAADYGFYLQYISDGMGSPSFSVDSTFATFLHFTQLTVYTTLSLVLFWLSMLVATSSNTITSIVDIISGVRDYGTAK